MKKSAIIVAIVFMMIGFAAVSTSLIINGNAKVIENNDDFSVIFTAASLDGDDVYSTAVDDTKKAITFTSKDLMKAGDTSILTYEVTNNSNNYDAEVKVTCVPKDGTTAKYTSIKNELEGNGTKVLAKESINGTLTITLSKQSTEEVSEEYTCKLEFNAVERDEVGYNGPTEWTFDYTGGEQTFIAPTSGTYKLETWGSQGGTYDASYAGGKGGYATGNIKLNKNQKLFVNIGQVGTCVTATGTSRSSYNGGAPARAARGAGFTSCSGGGATHIALSSGQLFNLENNINEILIVSGGGGGSTYRTAQNGGYFSGGSAGGYIGNTTTGHAGWSIIYSTGGDQNRGGTGGCLNGDSGASSGSFGQSNSCTSSNGSCSSGGGGFYGGGSGNDTGGGGGSGYIGNTILTEKVMYCYNCAESSEESTKTISTTCTSATPTENCSKQGNGYARITLIKQ